MKEQPTVIIVPDVHDLLDVARVQAGVIEQWAPEYIVAEWLSEPDPAANQWLVDQNREQPTLRDAASLYEKIATAVPTLPQDFTEVYARMLPSVREQSDAYVHAIRQVYKTGEASPEDITAGLQPFMSYQGVFPQNPGTSLDVPLMDFSSGLQHVLSDIFYLCAQEYGSMLSQDDIARATHVAGRLQEFAERREEMHLSSLIVAHAVAQVNGKLVGVQVDRQFENLDSADQSVYELAFAKTLLESAAARKGDAPVIGIIGRYHAREEGALCEALESAEVAYHVVQVPVLQLSPAAEAIRNRAYKAAQALLHTVELPAADI